MVKPQTLAPVLAEFFAGETAPGKNGRQEASAA